MRRTSLDIMSCCRSEASLAASSECVYYCLAHDQTAGDLAERLIKASEPGKVWCSTNANGTGTGVVTLSATTTGSESTATGSASGPTTTSTSNAASVVSLPVLSKSALGMVGLLLTGTFAGWFV
jgi:hypothetical protein